PFAVQLDYCSSFGPRIVMHPLGLKEKTARLDEFSLAFVEIVADRDSKDSAHYCHIDVSRMPVRTNITPNRPFEPDSVWSGFGGIARKNGELNAFRELRRSRPPRQLHWRLHYSHSA